MRIITCDCCKTIVGWEDVMSVMIRIGENVQDYDLCPVCMARIGKEIEELIYGEKPKIEGSKC